MFALNWFEICGVTKGRNWFKKQFLKITCNNNYNNRWNNWFHFRWYIILDVKYHLLCLCLALHRRAARIAPDHKLSWTWWSEPARSQHRANTPLTQTMNNTSQIHGSFFEYFAWNTNVNPCVVFALNIEQSVQYKILKIQPTARGFLPIAQPTVGFLHINKFNLSSKDFLLYLDLSFGDIVALCYYYYRCNHPLNPTYCIQHFVLI